MENFKKILCSKGHFTENETKHIIQGLASATAYLRKNDIVHRDLKVENILVKSSDTNGANEMKLNIKIGVCTTEINRIKALIRHEALYVRCIHEENTLLCFPVKQMLSRDRVLELMMEWNSNPDIGEKCRLGGESNNPATTRQQDEPSEAQESSTSNNSTIEFGAEIGTENAGNKSSTPAKQCVYKVVVLESGLPRKGALDKSLVPSTQELGNKSLLQSAVSLRIKKKS